MTLATNKETEIDQTIARLLGIMSFRRPHDHPGEAAAVVKYLTDYTPMIYDHPYTGETIAYAVWVYGETNEHPRTLFSCHVDTVHSSLNAEVRNPVIYDANLDMAYKEDGQPLGADDGAGMWLMLEMIDASVPGLYLFHRGEEKGGIGSTAMAKHYPDMLKQYDYAIAFDRRGTTSVITHQGWSRCCSDEFGLALATALNEQGLSYKLDDGGVYTDTAEYVGLIPECTNLSCGYDHEHSGNETLDVAHLRQLRAAMIAVFSKPVTLPVVRDPKVTEYKDDGDWMSSFNARWGQVTSHKRGSVESVKQPLDYADDDWDYGATYLDEYDIAQMTFSQVRQYVAKTDAATLADLLMDMADKLIDLQPLIPDDEDGPVSDTH